jgi:ATP-dependent Clp protease ATP-binding subunit ClpA
MNEDEFSKISKIDEELKTKIIGQDEAVEKISAAIKRSRVGISNPDQPIASFLFLGPTGVGKTELSKKIAEYLFNKKDSLIKVDMSELMESHSVSKLIGSPPGYVGFEDGGSLTEKVKRNPYSVILFDEIEKASPNILNILLQILDEGKVTDSKGQLINFKNTIIILTSNLGANANMVENKKIGFSLGEEVKENEKTNKNEEEIKKTINDYLSPEFLNRLDEIIIFKKLSQKDVLKIANLELNLIKERLLKNNIEIELDEKVLKKIIGEKYNYDFGARPLKRLLEEKILNPLSEEILAKKNQAGKFKISLDKKGELKFNFSVTKNIKNKKLALSKS